MSKSPQADSTGYTHITQHSAIPNQIGSHGVNFDTPKLFTTYKVRARLALGPVRVLSSCKHTNGAFFLKLRLPSIRQRIPELMASGKNQTKSENGNKLCKLELKRKGKNHTKLLIALHGVLTFLQETSQCQRLLPTLLPSSLFCILVP